MTAQHDPHRPSGHTNGNGSRAPGADPFGEDSGEPGDRFTFVYPHQITLKARLWLTAGILSRYGFGVLFGPSGCGKSFWAIRMALCVALGLDLLDKPTKQAGTIYVAAEDAEGVQFRTIAALKALGVERAADIPLAIIPEAPDLWNADEGDTEALIAAINEQAAVLREHGAALGLIVIDTYRDAMPGLEENNSKDTSAAVRTLRRIGKETGALVIVVHHIPKGGDGEDPRGSTALIGAADVALGVRFEGPRSEGEDVAPGPPQRVLWLRKLRNGPDARADQSLSWAYSLERIELDVIGGDGEPETSCAVRVTGAPRPSPRRCGKLPDRAVIVLRAVQACLSNGGVANPPGVRIPAGSHAVRADDVREHAGKLGLAGTSVKNPADALRVAFNRGKQDLIARNKLYEMEGWLWLPRP